MSMFERNRVGGLDCFVTLMIRANVGFFCTS